MRWHRRAFRTADEQENQVPLGTGQDTAPEEAPGLLALERAVDVRLSYLANGGRREETLLAAQRLLGNGSAQRLFGGPVSRPPLVVRLPGETRCSLSTRVFLQRADAAVPGQPEEPAEIQEELAPVTVPFADAIRGGIALSHRTEKGEVPLGATDFGKCISVVGGATRVRKIEGFWSDTYEVEARTDITYKWATQSCGCTDVLGPMDPAVTPDTWQEIVTDLTPGPTGRPPRHRYYCSDLTAQHELFHRDDMQAAYERYKTFENIWLAGEEASSTQEALRKARQARDMMLMHVHRYMGGGVESEYNPAELRAYGAGRGAYLARATDIGLRAQREGWATVESPPPAAPGHGSPPREALADSG